MIIISALFSIYTFLLTSYVHSQTDSWPALLSTSTVMPTFISLNPNINDYKRFADGGADANWYIGFNNAWIAKLPPIPRGDFARAFIGARLGRAKTRPNADKPWLRERIPGQIYIAVAQTPQFPAERSYFLAEASDIPAEPDTQAVVNGAGTARWLWASIPMGQLSSTHDNYIAVWSPTTAFSDAVSAPILAAAANDTGHETRAWNNHSISGVAPRSTAGALETPVSFLPALAIMLAPSGTRQVDVSDLRVETLGRRTIVRFTARGDDVDQAWVETSRDQLDWRRLPGTLYNPPFAFTFNADQILTPGTFLRGAARSLDGTVGASDTYAIPYVLH